MCKDFGWRKEFKNIFLRPYTERKNLKQFLQRRIHPGCGNRKFLLTMGFCVFAHTMRLRCICTLKLICLACRMGSGCSLAVLDMAVFRRVSPWISSELGTMRGLLLKSLTSCLPVPSENMCRFRAGWNHHRLGTDGDWSCLQGMNLRLKRRKWKMPSRKASCKARSMLSRIRFSKRKAIDCDDEKYNPGVKAAVEDRSCSGNSQRWFFTHVWIWCELYALVKTFERFVGTAREGICMMRHARSSLASDSLSCLRVDDAWQTVRRFRTWHKLLLGQRVAVTHCQFFCHKDANGKPSERVLVLPSLQESQERLVLGYSYHSLLGHAWSSLLTRQVPPTLSSSPPPPPPPPPRSSSSSSTSSSSFITISQ